MNSATPTMKTVRRERASPSRPAGTSAMPKAREYPATTHWMSLSSAPSPVRIEGSATLTMLTSSRHMPPATRHTTRARQRLRCSSALSASVPGSVVVTSSR